MKTQELLIREQFILIGTLLTLFLKHYLYNSFNQVCKRKEEELNKLNKRIS